MRALFFDGDLKFRRDAPKPAPRAAEALVRVRMAGICRTDIELTKGYMDFKGVPGHEFVGKVVEAENGALVGKRVVGEINCACGRCELCRSGLSKHCRRRTVLGIALRDGAFADFLTLPVENLRVLPAHLPDEAAVFTEPVAACYEILTRGFDFRDVPVVVLGDGKLGILMAQVLHVAGARVLAIGKHEHKLSILKSLGISTAMKGHVETGRYDFLVECTGSPEGLREALRIARPRAVIFAKTTVSQESALDLAKLVVDEISLMGSRCGPFEPAIDALGQGKIKVGGMIEGIFDFENVMQAFQAAMRPGALKVLVRINPNA